MVQMDVLDRVESANLAVYVVWEPILRTDDERASRKATTLFHDDRLANFWASTTEIGSAFQSPIGLTTEPAWDVYLLYLPGAQWGEETPPRPTYFMHQLAGRLPEPQLLNGSQLAAMTRYCLRE